MNNWNRLGSIGNKTDVHDAMRRPDVLESPTKNIADHQVDVLKQVCDERFAPVKRHGVQKSLKGFGWHSTACYNSWFCLMNAYYSQNLFSFMTLNFKAIKFEMCCLGADVHAIHCTMWDIFARVTLWAKEILGKKNSQKVDYFFWCANHTGPLFKLFQFVLKREKTQTKLHPFRDTANEFII